jgi:hypothetical protein
MTLTDFASSPETVRVARWLAESLRASRSAPRVFRQSRNFELLESADVDLADVSEEIPPENETPTMFMLGIYGVGVGTDGGQEYPLLAVDTRVAGMESGSRLPVSELALADLVESELPELGRSPIPVLAQAVKPPTPYFGPGAAAQGGGGEGTLGALVRSVGNVDGILTAGHVAGQSGAVLADSDGVIGTVSFIQVPNGKGVGHPSADVAVVDVDPTAGDRVTPNISISTSDRARSLDEVVCYGATTGLPQQDTSVAWFEYFFVRSMGGEWGNIFQTENSISQGGDSGSPVLRVGTDAILGHVVGGEPGRTTYIQSIDFQLAVSGTKLR